MPKLDIRELYYITHIDNLPSILSRGVYSHEKIEAEGVHSTHIYDADIVNRRNQITAPDKRSLVNIYTVLTSRLQSICPGNIR